MKPKPPICDNALTMLEHLACNSPIEFFGLLLGRAALPEMLMLVPGGVGSSDGGPLLAAASAILSSIYSLHALVHTHPGGCEPSPLDELVAELWGAPSLVVGCGCARWVDGGVVERLGYSCSLALLGYNGAMHA